MQRYRTEPDADGSVASSATERFRNSLSTRFPGKTQNTSQPRPGQTLPQTRMTFTTDANDTRPQRFAGPAAATRHASLLAAVILSLCACGEKIDDPVRIRISLAESSPLHNLSDVNVVVGSDRFHLQRIAAGESQSVNLQTESGVPREITLLYRIDGQRLQWTGPPIPADGPYRVELNIRADGTVNYDACRFPCRGGRATPRTLQP